MQIPGNQVSTDPSVQTTITDREGFFFKNAHQPARSQNVQITEDT